MPWLIAAQEPATDPLARVWFITTAKLGPGDIAPKRHARSTVTQKLKSTLPTKISSISFYTVISE